MNEDQREQLEHRILQACRQDDFDTAVTLAVEGFGPEVLGCLVTVVGNEDAALDLFQEWCQRVHLHMPRFEWRSSFRTWAYRIANNLQNDWFRSPRRREQPLPTDKELELPGPRQHEHRLPQDEALDLPNKARSQTPLFRRTTFKERIRALRERLSPDEIQLLVLRVDQNMAWKEVAEIVSAGGQPTTAETLRQRFQRIKKKVFELAREEGLVK